MITNMRILLGLITILSSCLIIGSPKVSLFKSKNNLKDTIMLSSYSQGTMYSYKASIMYDSVLLLEPMDLTYKKMNFYTAKEYTYSQKEKTKNVKKIEELKELYLKRYFKNIITYDTLFRLPLAGARLPRVNKR